MTNLKDNIWIEGVDSNAKRYDFLASIGGRKNVIWDGRVEKIPEEVARECVEIICAKIYKHYSNNNLGTYTARESIQSACTQEYCIIYRNNLKPLPRLMRRPRG